MKRKLLLLNALLAGVCILAGADLWRQYLEDEARMARLDVVAPDAVPPAQPDQPQRPQVRPGEYMPIVEHMLFSKDRNAVIEVEEPVVVVEQRPELPIMSGLIDFGDGPQALMAAASDGDAKWIGIGDKVGAFVFAGVDGEKIKLTWKEEEIVVERSQLVASARPKRERKTAQQRSGPPGGRGSEARSAAADLAASAPAPDSIGGKHNIGNEFLPGKYRADPNDEAPNGSVWNGYVKTVRRTPFGNQAWWEKK